MRKGISKKRILVPDPKYKDVLVTRFVNNLMLDGKKSVAYRIFYDTIDRIEEKTKLFFLSFCILKFIIIPLQSICEKNIRV